MVGEGSGRTIWLQVSFFGGDGKPQDSSDDFQDMAWKIRVIRRLFLPNIIGRE